MGDITPARGNKDGCNVGGSWRKSSYSMSNGQCVEVAVVARDHSAGGCIGIRDSVASTGPVLCVERRAWSAFLAEVRAPSSFAS
jgi:Domain of unknown function (DUF397)